MSTTFTIFLIVICTLIIFTVCYLRRPPSCRTTDSLLKLLISRYYILHPEKSYNIEYYRKLQKHAFKEAAYQFNSIMFELHMRGVDIDELLIELQNEDRKL